MESQASCHDSLQLHAITIRFERESILLELENRELWKPSSNQKLPRSRKDVYTLFFLYYHYCYDEVIVAVACNLLV